MGKMENGFLCEGKREKEKKKVKYENGRKYWWKIRKMVGNINGNIRIILYKYNMYSLTFSLAFAPILLININIVPN